MGIVIFCTFGLCLFSGCAEKKPLAPSIVAELYEQAQAYRLSLSDAEVRERCDEQAVGTVVAVERAQNQYFPLRVDMEASDSGLFRSVPLEQWSGDLWIVTVEIDEVLKGTLFKDKSIHRRAFFSLPIEFSELEYWDEEAPRYTGRKISVYPPDEPPVSIGDRVELLTRRLGAFALAVGSFDSFVFLGDERMTIGGVSAGEYNPSIPDNYDRMYRRNVVKPRADGVSILETAFIEPMESLRKLSPDKAQARSSFAVRGTVTRTVSWTSEFGIESSGVLTEEIHYLETWDKESWAVYIRIDEVLKQDGLPIEPGDGLAIVIPTRMTDTESGKEFLFDAVVPAEGDKVAVCWNEGYMTDTRSVAAEFILVTDEGSPGVLYGFVDREPVVPGSDGSIPID